MCIDNEPTPCQTVNPTPTISEFVVYAERSVKLGDCGKVSCGAVGIHAIAEPNFGFQLVIGAGSVIDEQQNVYSPSTNLGRDVFYVKCGRRSILGQL